MSTMPRRTQRLIVASALVETIAGKVEARAARSIETLHGQRADRPALSCRRSTITISTLGDAVGKLRSGGDEQHVAWRSRARPSSSPPTAAPASCIRRRPSAKSTSTCCIDEQARFVPGEGPAVDLRRRPRRQVHRRSARLPRPLGQGGRQAISRASCGIAGCSIIKSSTCTSIRSAGGPKKIR